MLLNLPQLHEHQNVYYLISKCLDFFNLKFTRYNLEQSISAHHDMPSLSGVKDILSIYGIQCAAVRKANYSYTEFQAPFICLVKDQSSETYFVLVTDAEAGKISYFDPKRNRSISSTSDEFEKIAEEIILLLDDSDKSHEEFYDINRKEGAITLFLKSLPFISLLSLALFTQFSKNHQGQSTLISTLYLFSSCAGLAITSFLLWYEIDAHNPFFKKICGGPKAKDVNCSKVLASAGSKFLRISWSVWGFAYFATFFLSQVTISDGYATDFWGLVSCVVLPYVGYSVYYQKMVVKKWCTLCLLLQLVLVVNVVCYLLFGNGLFSSLNYTFIGWVVLLGLFNLGITHQVVSTQRRANTGKIIENKWRKLRYDPSVFNVLLQKERKVAHPADMGLLLGNPAANIEIIKVCNPYCEPCAIAHKELKKFLENNTNVKLRILFNTSGRLDDGNTIPVIYLLAINEKFGCNTAGQALDDWFLSGSKNLKEFAGRYALEGNIDENLIEAGKMSQWCNTHAVKATPSFFINGYALPEDYSYDDFKYLF